MEREDPVVALSPTVDRTYVVVAVAAAALALAQGPRTGLVLTCVLVALLPWGWAAGRRPCRSGPSRPWPCSRWCPWCWCRGSAAGCSSRPRWPAGSPAAATTGGWSQP